MEEKAISMIQVASIWSISQIEFVLYITKKFMRINHLNLFDTKLI